jgi:hypothetical protein
MAKVQHDGAQVTVTCTDQPVVQLRIALSTASNLTISLAEAVCLQKALGIVLGGG